MHYKKKTVKSWIWTSICRGIEVIKLNHCWAIGDGINIKLWTDKWLPNGACPVPRTGVSVDYTQKVSEPPS